MLLAACVNEHQDKFRIGVSQCSDDDWRDKLNEEINREMLFHDDASVEILIADDDNEKQIKDIQYFIDNKFDIIIASPNQAEALTPILSTAYKKGIPVIVFDRGVNGDDYTCYMEFDNEGIGNVVAQYVSKITAGPTQIIEITGLPGSTPAEDRHRGFINGIAANSDLKMLTSISGNWKEHEAERIMDSLIRVFPEVDLVYAHNDLMAIGVSKALSHVGRRDVIVIGNDAVPNVGLEAVRDGVIDATFMYPTDGQRLIQAAISILKGKSFKRDDIIPAQSSAIDSRMAEILIGQDSLLHEETKKITFLKDKNDTMLAQYRVQRSFLLSMIAVGVLLLIALALLLKVFWQRNRFQRILTVKNEQLEQERDKQAELYQQLDEATKSKLIFFTNVSHDLRTPLALIAEPVEVLAKEDYLTDSDKVLMRIASKNVRILRRLIDQILDFRKYENNKSSLNLVEVDTPRMFSEWIDSFKSVAKKRNIKLIVGNLPDGPRSMAIDLDKIERVFFNLMSNAFKYTPDGGEIVLSFTCDMNTMTFSVSDNGKGIAEEDLDRIFDRFYQVDKVRPQGSGIGLSLTKAFIELHSGTITVKSSIGKGSTFTVSLPVRHVKSVAESQTLRFTEADIIAELETLSASEMTFDNNKPLILVVDDNPDIQSLTKELLSADFNVITASNAREGLKLATKYVPDLIISDIMMPEIDGFEYCKMIKNEISTSHIPVLMLTACRMDEQRMQSYDCGADGYLSKPFNKDVLISRCRNLILNRQHIKDIYSNSSVTENADKNKEGKRTLSNLNDKASIESDFYESFLSIVKKELGNSELSIEDIAGRFGIGPVQFTRKIKALTNQSPVEIIRHLRLRNARTLLLSSEKIVSEIAYEVGFSSPAYFSKCFKDEFGESPTELRNKVSS